MVIELGAERTGQDVGRNVCLLGVLVAVVAGSAAWLGCDAGSSCDPSMNCVPEVPIATDGGPDAVAPAAEGGAG